MWQQGDKKASPEQENSWHKSWDCPVNLGRWGNGNWDIKWMSNSFSVSDVNPRHEETGWELGFLTLGLMLLLYNLKITFKCQVTDINKFFSEWYFHVCRFENYCTIQPIHCVLSAIYQTLCKAVVN